MSREAAIKDLMQELARHIDRRAEEAAGEPLPVALFVFDGPKAHAVVSGDWDAVRDALAAWADQARVPETQFSLRDN